MPKSKEEKVPRTEGGIKNKSDRNIKRVEPDLETDKFGENEQKEIVDMVIADAEFGIEAMKTWRNQKRLDIQHYDGDAPSRLEQLEKLGWQSDRNLGMCAATCDIYQATLLATCWNPETIHFIATEKNDVDNKSNLERFTKWAVSKSESNVFPEIDEFIHNRITQGFSCFHIYWKVWYDWVDRRIPKPTGGYTIKTERVRFEKGIIENISNVDDIIIPNWGKNIQELSFFIHVIHKNSSDLLDEKKRKIWTNVTQKFVDSLKNVILDQKRNGLSEEKAKQLGIKDVTDQDIRIWPIDLYRWHGYYTKDKRREKYRFTIEPSTRTLVEGKPLRKITRSGKIPYVGGPFIRRPGFLLGKSLCTLIAPIVNALNNVFNQKSDFQYVENCPTGFYNPDEGYTRGSKDLIPGKMYPTEGNPKEAVYFPNFQRSMAWAAQDISLLFEILEKLTGAAAYFLTSRSKQSTLGRDEMVEEKGETKFGLWVKRIRTDLEEAISMYINMYQDWAPPKLGERVLGTDGKQLIRNLSVESLRGGYDARMTENVTSGSKILERQIQMWALENLSQSVWMNPQINPKGSWNLYADSLKSMGKEDVERYLPPEPKLQLGKGPNLDEEWARFAQGEVFDPVEGENLLEHFIGHMQQKEDKYYELDKEYRPNFDAHLFKTVAKFQDFIRESRQENIANAMALGTIQDRNAPAPGPVGPAGPIGPGGPVGPEGPIGPGGPGAV